MAATLTRLYPTPAGEVSVRGLYLAHRLHELGPPDRTFVYANFVESLDGRIATRKAADGLDVVPRELASPEDLRLLLELHAQADCLVTNAGYLRAIADGRLGDILQVGTVAGHEDLLDWRDANGLRRQPAVCIASASLEFELPASLARNGQQVFVATGREAPAGRIAALERDGCRVIVAGRERDVEGAPLARMLAAEGMRSAFLLAGPKMLDAMLRDRALSRFYITITHELLGGEHFRSLLDGPPTAGAGRLELRALYFDPPRADAHGQFFAQFEPVRSAES